MAERANGYILLHRSLQDHWLWNDKPFSKGQAWVDLLLLVNYKPGKTMFNKQLCDVDRGERVTSNAVLSERWGWSETKVKKFLDTLESDGMIELKKDHKKTVVKVLNYGDYQIGIDEKKPLKDHRKSAENPVEDHRKTTERPQKIHEYNEVNKGNKGNEINNIPPIVPQADWHDRFSASMVAKLEEWLAYKQEKRQNYKPTGLKTLINKAEKEVAQYGETAVIEVIDASMSSGYQGIVWDRLASGRAGTKMAGHAGSKTSGGNSNPFLDMLSQMGVDQNDIK